MVNTCYTPASDFTSTYWSQRLVETLQRLQAQVPNAIPGSIYIYDLIDQRTLYASCSVATLLGYPADGPQAIEPDGLGSLIHPDDLPLVSDHYQRFTTLHTGQVITTHYRMKRADGAWCWLRSQETSLIQAIDGFPLQVLGIVQVPTERVAPSLEELLRQVAFFNHLN